MSTCSVSLITGSKCGSCSSSCKDRHGAAVSGAGSQHTDTFLRARGGVAQADGPIDRTRARRETGREHARGGQGRRCCQPWRGCLVVWWAREDVRVGWGKVEAREKSIEQRPSRAEALDKISKRPRTAPRTLATACRSWFPGSPCLPRLTTIQG